MVAFIGRRVQFFWGGNSPGDDIPGVREKSVSVSGEPIDITSDENSGWRTLLDDPAQNEVNISLSGVTKSDRLKTDFFNGERTQAVRLVYPDGGVISGDFRMANYEETGAYNDAVTFSCELQSTGAITFVAG